MERLAGKKRGEQLFQMTDGVNADCQRQIERVIEIPVVDSFPLKGFKLHRAKILGLGQEDPQARRLPPRVRAMCREERLRLDCGREAADVIVQPIVG